MPLDWSVPSLSVSSSLGLYSLCKTFCKWKIIISYWTSRCKPSLFQSLFSCVFCLMNTTLYCSGGITGWVKRKKKNIGTSLKSPTLVNSLAYHCLSTDETEIVFLLQGVSISFVCVPMLVLSEHSRVCSMSPWLHMVVKCTAWGGSVYGVMCLSWVKVVYMLADLLKEIRESAFTNWSKDVALSSC